MLVHQRFFNGDGCHTLFGSEKSSDILFHRILQLLQEFSEISYDITSFFQSESQRVRHWIWCCPNMKEFFLFDVHLERNFFPINCKWGSSFISLFDFFDLQKNLWQIHTRGFYYTNNLKTSNFEWWVIMIMIT